MRRHIPSAAGAAERGVRRRIPSAAGAAEEAKAMAPMAQRNSGSSRCGPDGGDGRQGYR